MPSGPGTKGGGDPLSCARRDRMREEPLKVEAFFIFFLSLLRECGGGERGNGLLCMRPCALRWQILMR